MGDLLGASHVHWPFLGVSQESPEFGVQGSQE